jgi:hypothetical protein
MSERIVRSQTELNQAVADKVDWIEICSPQGVWIEVRACDSSTVRACDSSTVRAYDSSTVRAYDSSTVRAYGSSTVRAYDSSTVTACDSSTVTAYGSSTVRAYGSSTVTACGSSTVRAYDSSTVTAYGSSTVRAYGSSTVTAYGSSTVTASSHTAVHLHSGRANITGGVLIDHTAVDQSAPATWASYHGAQLANEDTVTVYKAVRTDLRSGHGALYTIGAEVTCDDWRDTNECGNGLHFSPSPAQALSYDFQATRFLECTVNLSDLRPLTDSGTAKAKTRRAFVVREVDIAGRPIAAAEVA